MFDLRVNDKLCKVYLKRDSLFVEDTTARRGKLSENREISTEAVLATHYLDINCQCVRVHYVVRHTNRRLRVRTCDFVGNVDACKEFKEELEKIINAFSRPKRLLIFVNPKSGHQKGVKIYNSKVLPLLRLAGIHVELKVTSKPGEPEQLLANSDLSLIHGIVSVGGDGMYSECVNGLLARLQRDSGVNMNDPESEITPSNIPIGIVPAGSGNYLVNYIHGTRDVQTAVIKIILGGHHMSNVVSLHQGQSLTRYASLLMEFGLIGEMMHDCEKHRGMGPTRYKIVPPVTMFRRKTVDVQVEYLPAEQAKTPNIKRFHYSRQASVPASQISNKFCHRMISMPDGKSPKNNEWQRLEGSVYGVDTYVVTQREKQGVLAPRFADSALTMWLTDKCSLPKHVEQLTRLQKAKAGFLDFEFVRSVRATRYRVTLPSAPVKVDSEGQRHLTKNYYINADGEAITLEQPQFEVKLHHCAIPIYGTIDG